MSIGHQLSNLAAATLFGGVFICVNFVIQMLEGAFAIIALALTGGLALVLCIIASVRNVREKDGQE